MRLDVDADPIVVEFVAVGAPGRDGIDGLGADDIEAVCALALPAGMPVAVDRTTGKFIAADAAWKPAAFAAGLLRADAETGFVAPAATQQLTLPDWTAVAGTAQLAPGQPYFLAVGGGLTTVAPTSECVAMVGKALNATTLLINPQPPIER
jgi:hypothetical protein